MATSSDRINGEALPSAYSAVSIERALTRFGWLGDPDDLLAQLGITRTKLRAIEHDDEVSAALDTRRAACINTPWRIEHPQARARAFFESAIAPHIDAILVSAWSAIPYGYSVFETVWLPPDAPNSPVPGKIGIAQVIDCPFEWFRILPDGTLQWRDTMTQADPLHFFATVNAGSLRKPMGEALLAKCYWPWFFRAHGWRMWAKFLEQAAIPLLYGKTVGDKEALVNLLRNVSQGPVMAVNDNDEIGTVDLPGNSPNKFTEFETAITRRIQRLILGQTLTSGTDGGSGNRALGEVHNEVRAEKKRADVKIVTRTVQGVIDTLARLNGIEPARFVMEDGTGLERERAERDKILADAGMLRFTRRYLEEKYGFEPDDFEEVRQDGQASANFATFAAKRQDNTKPDRRRFTAAQQAIEDEIERTLSSLGGGPVSQAAIISAIRGAKDAEDLQERLAVVLRDADDRAFRQTFERALFAAEIMGYAAAQREAISE